MVQELTQFNVTHIAKEIAAQILAEIRRLVASEQLKDWYSTSELAAALD